MKTTVQAPATDTTELTKMRNHLHDLINEAENIAVLEAIATLLTVKNPADIQKDRAVNLADLTPAARAAVEEGLRDIDAGRVIPNAEVWAPYAAKYGIQFSR